MRAVCGDRQACSPGLHAWGSGRGEVGEMGERRRWMKKDYVVDLVETLFANLDMR